MYIFPSQKEYIFFSRTKYFVKALLSKQAFIGKKKKQPAVMRTLLRTLPWVNSFSQKPRSPGHRPGVLSGRKSNFFVSIPSWCRGIQKWEQKNFLHMTRVWHCADCVGSRLKARKIWGLGSIPVALRMWQIQFVQSSWHRVIGANSFVTLVLYHWVLRC